MQILVTGNGFDLAHGLPTRYLDFINTLNFLKNTPLNNLNGLYDLYFSNQSFKHLIGEEIYNINEIEEFKNNLNNVWFNYFSDQLEIDTWIDFETKLENTLLKLNNEIDYIKTKIFNSDNDHTLTFYIQEHIGFSSTRFQLLENFDLIKLHSMYSDQFILSSKYCKFNKKSNSYCEFNEDEFFKFLTLEWESFIHLFNDYIKIFVNPLIDRIDVEQLLFVTRHYTFNYSNTYEKVLHKRTITSHLHGKISDSKNLVLGFDHFGYDNLSKNLIPFTKGFQRLNKDSDYRFLKHLDIHDRHLYIYFWGHSMDISDKKFIDEAIALIRGEIDGRSGILKLIYHSSKGELLKNLCNIYGINMIESLMSEKKIEFIKSDSLKDEFRHIENKDRSLNMTNSQL